MNKKLSLLLAIALMAGTFPAQAALTAPAAAQDRSATPPATSQRCERLTNDIAARVTRYQENHLKHVETYKGIKTRAQNIATKLDGKGYDLTALKEDIKTLDAKIAKFEKDYSDYIKKLAATKSFVCGQSEGQFASKLKDARDALKLVSQDATDIRTFYKSDIRPDLKTIRDQIAKAKAVQDEEEPAAGSASNQ
ncbi:MAG: hypothetical protein ACM3NH_01705 [Candidatus Saccharibacteria bacterium]